MDGLDRREALVLPALLIPYLWLVQRYWFVCDDAFITWRYSRHVAEGLGPTYNVANELPVEGYSDFLWMLIAAVFEAARMQPRIWIPVVSAACGISLVLWIWWFLRARVGALPALLGGLLAGCFPPFAVWSTSGLEVMPQVLFMWGIFALLGSGDDRRDPWLAGLLGLSLALIRTEGIAWAVVLGGIAGGMRHLDHRPVRAPLLRYAALVLIPFAVYFSWRSWYYESLLSNTAKVKVHLEPVTLLRGMMYIGLYLSTLITPLLFLAAWPLAWRTRWRPEVLGAGLMALAVPAYAVVVSGDYMTWFRILVPGVPFMAFVAGVALDQVHRARGPITTAAIGLLTIGLGLLPAMDIFLTPEPLRDALNIREKLGFFRTENMQWEAMNEHVVTWTEKGLALKEYARPGDTYVAAAIGATGYYSDIYIYDRNGLVNREVAELPWEGELRSPGHDKVVDRSFFFDRKPDILDCKVITGNRMFLQIKTAMREMEATEVKDTYFPDVYPLDRSGGANDKGDKAARFLLALRRCASVNECGLKWAEFKTQLAQLKGTDDRLEDLDEDGAGEVSGDLRAVPTLAPHPGASPGAPPGAPPAEVPAATPGGVE